MPECIDCGKTIQSGARCQIHRLEHQHGGPADLTGGDVHDQPTCPACGNPVPSGAPTANINGQTGHLECQAQVRCDGGWTVKQQGLDGEPAEGQTTIDGGIAKDGGED